MKEYEIEEGDNVTVDDNRTGLVTEKVAKMPKILITGVAGFIGFHAAKHFLSMGYIVIGVDNVNDYYDVNLKYARLANLGVFSPKESSRGNYDCSHDRSYYEIEFHEGVVVGNFKFVRLDVQNKDLMTTLIREEGGVDKVLHLAAQAGVRYSLENPQVYIDSNINGFLSILEVCREFKIMDLVYASSSSVYGSNTKVPFEESDPVDNPVSLYAVTKRSNELMATTYNHLFGMRTTGLRFFTVYGPWGRPDMSPMLFASAISSGKPINVFNGGNMSRDFTFIDDIIRGISLIVSSTDSLKPIYNIGAGHRISLPRFIDNMEIGLGRRVHKNQLPMQDGDVADTWSSTKLLNDDLGFTSMVGIESGVRYFVNWFNEFYKGNLYKCSCYIKIDLPHN